MHAELAAVFEGKRKFDAELRPTVDANLAREIQRTVATLEKSKLPDLPIISPDASDAARELLEFPKTRQFSTNDYHVHRRPGEVINYGPVSHLFGLRTGRDGSGRSNIPSRSWFRRVHGSTADRG
jgi:hypothetical protein